MLLCDLEKARAAKAEQEAKAAKAAESAAKAAQAAAQGSASVPVPEDADTMDVDNIFESLKEDEFEKVMLAANSGATTAEKRQSFMQAVCAAKKQRKGPYGG